MSERLDGDLPVGSATDVAGEIGSRDSVLVSGFGRVGYPKEVPRALADADRDLSLTLVSGGSVGPEIDVELVRADAIDRCFPYQAQSPAQEAVNAKNIAFHDRNVGTLGDEGQYGNLTDAEFAVVEALAVGPDWLVPTMSIGQSPAFVEAADRLIVEVNSAVPDAVREFTTSTGRVVRRTGSRFH
jgi:succinyl-CoA:acetate CoA-transferase